MACNKNALFDHENAAANANAAAYPFTKTLRCFIIFNVNKDTFEGNANDLCMMIVLAPCTP